MADAPFKPFALGRYHVLQPLGSGGMGEVFLADDSESPGRLVAIKRVKPQLEKNARFIKMLRAEGTLVSSLQNMHIVQVFGVEEAEGRHFVVMEYIDGCDLSRLLGRLAATRKKLPVPVAAYIAWSALRGLGHAHLAKDTGGKPLKIVHRDISPGNVLVTQRGLVKLSDFGVAGALALMNTADRRPVGKPAYTAPELLERGGGDQRADIFSAGIVLWETLTGKRLFKGATDNDVVEAVKSRAIQAPSEIDRGVSAQLSALTMKALERNPAKRFQTAAEFERALQATFGDTKPRAFADGLARFLGQLFPLLRPEDIAALPRPAPDEEVSEEPPAPADAGWSDINESFERPLEQALAGIDDEQEYVQDTPTAPGLEDDDGGGATAEEEMGVVVAGELDPALLGEEEEPAAATPVPRDEEEPAADPTPVPDEEEPAAEPTPVPQDEEEPAPIPQDEQDDVSIVMTPPPMEDEAPPPDERTAMLDAEEVAMVVATEYAASSADEEEFAIEAPAGEDEAYGGPTDEHDVVDTGEPQAGWPGTEGASFQELPYGGAEEPPYAEEGAYAQEPAYEAPPPEPSDEAVAWSDNPEAPIPPPDFGDAIPPPDFGDGPIPPPDFGDPSADGYDASAPAAASAPPPPSPLELLRTPAPFTVTDAHGVRGMSGRDLINRLRDKQCPRELLVAVGTTQPRSSVELGCLLALDQLALFPGLGDEARHKGSANTDRMQSLLAAYANSRQTGALSLIGKEPGQYAAFFVVQGMLQYICLSNAPDNLMDAIINVAEVGDARLNALAGAVVIEGQGLVGALQKAELVDANGLYQGIMRFNVARFETIRFWGQCSFEFRPGVQLPYPVPVPNMPLSALLGAPPERAPDPLPEDS